MELYQKSATELAALLRLKQASAVEITTSIYDRIRRVEPLVDAFLTLEEPQAQKHAAATDELLARGDVLPPLAGIPVAIKDNICTRGTRTTCASRMLENFIPPYDATVISKLKQAGAVLVGKVNMDEFAMGSSCENSYFKPTKNPWNIEHIPGGSSGGSAASVAACEVPLALGSDTGGSVRCPASHCGVVGLKPTYGAVSRFGLVAFASSLEQIGPFARTVDDTALLYSVLCGQDRMHDATSKDVIFNQKLTHSVKGLRIGIPKEYFGAGIHPEVKNAVMTGVKQFEKMGAVVTEISLPSTEYALSAYYIISSAEASSNLARYDGVKYGFSAGREGGLTQMYEATRSEAFGAEVIRRILLGTYVLSSGYYDAYYKRAKILQRTIAEDFNSAFQNCDLLITPTCPSTAFKLGEKVSDPLAMYAADICTVPLNIAGLPGVSIPCGVDSGGLPIGMQMMGPKFSENRLLSAAKCYETAIGGFPVKEMNV